MARKKEETTMVYEPLKKTRMKIELIGDSDLILHGKSRYYENSEVWKQSHQKGTPLPELYKQPKNNWESLITSIHWLNPIEYHDEDISLYSEEEWKDYMTNNKPCILAQAFQKSFAEAFVTFYKDSVKKNGTDIIRALNMIGDCYPIDFDTVEHQEKIVPTKGKSGGSPVLCVYNLFHNWKCEIEVSCPDSVFPDKMILSLIATTGEFMGIGTQRLNGFGRYHLGNVSYLEKRGE